MKLELAKQEAAKLKSKLDRVHESIAEQQAVSETITVQLDALNSHIAKLEAEEAKKPAPQPA